MNYIKTLEKTIEKNFNDSCDVIQAIGDKLRYLQSTKFHNDTTIQVKEFHDFLIEIRSSLYDIKANNIKLFKNIVEKE